MAKSGETEEEQLARLGKTLKEGERILAPTRRPDGTLRKPIRIRAGYVPQDEVAIYQSKGALLKKGMGVPEVPPGYDPVVDGKPKTKSAKRNERKKEKKQQFITDNGSNYKAAGDILMETHDTLYWTPCAAHCINLMLQDLGKEIAAIKDVLPKARSVVVYIYNHGRVLNMMRKLSKSELHRSCVTRFATFFYTLESMHKNKHHVQSLFVSSGWSHSAFAKTTKGKAAQKIVLSTTFWKNVHLACSVLAPLVDVIRLVDRESKPCMGYIYDAMERAKLQIEKNIVGEDARIITKVNEIVDRRWKDQLDHPLHSAGYYLNPEIFYKRVRTDPHMRQVKRRLYMALDRMVRDVVENDKIRMQLEEYEVASGDFGSAAAIRLKEKVAPSQWWNMHGLGTPELQNFAMRVLNQTCSASPCERNWSAFDNTASEKGKNLNSPEAEEANAEEVLSSEDTGSRSEAVKSVVHQMNKLDISKNSLVATAIDSTENSNPEIPSQDLDKKIRALKKKIRLTEAQIQKTERGDMKPEQLDKVAKLESWREELKLLEDKKPELPAS